MMCPIQQNSATCGMCTNHIVVGLLNEHPYRTFHDCTLPLMLPWQLHMHVHPGKHRFVVFVKVESETLSKKQQWSCHFYLYLDINGPMYLYGVVESALVYCSASFW